MVSVTSMVNRLLDDGGFSEVDLAALVGLSQPTIHRIKGGAGTSYEKGKAIEQVYLVRFGSVDESGSRLSA